MKMMKKILMALGVVLCCVVATVVLTSCQKDKNEFSYKIIVEPGGTLMGDAAAVWVREVMSVYQAALDVDSDEFKMNGSEEECNKHVLETCKKAEATLKVGGSGEIKVHNTTVNRTIYRRVIL